MSEDPHERRLRTLFARFASGERLHKQSLIALCHELQLPPHAPDSLLPTGRDLDFIQFRNRLLILLASEPTLAPTDSSAPRSLSPDEQGRSSKPHSLRRCISVPDNGHELQIDQAQSTPFRYSVPLDEARINQFTNQNKLDAYLSNKNPHHKIDRISSMISYDSTSDKDCIVSQSSDLTRMLPLHIIADLWESAGIPQSNQLLKDLGFRNDKLKPDDLLNALEEEIKITTNDLPMLNCDPLTVLFRAILIIYRYEIDYAKNILSQTIAERDKVKSDLIDANKRVILLADDIDENHLKVETALKSKIKRLEQKHADDFQQIESKFEEEKDCYTLTISNLEKKITNLECEEIKLKAQLNQMSIECDHYEKEKVNLQERLDEITEINKKLLNEIKNLKSNRERDMQSENYNDVNILEQKLQAMLDENILLKDKNDELFVELEDLRLKFDKKLCSLSESKCIQDETHNTPSINGIKRRGISPSSSLAEFSGEETSPRISKIRKCNDKISICDDDKLKTYDVTDNCSLDLKSCFLDDHNFIKYMISEEFKNDKNSQDESLHIKRNIMDKIVHYFKEMNCDTFTKVLSESHHKSLYLILYFLVSKIKSDITNNFSVANIFNNELSTDSMNILQECINEIGNHNFEHFLKSLSDLNIENYELSINMSNNAMITDIHSNKTEIDDFNEIINKLKSELDKEKIENANYNEKVKELEDNIESLRNMYEECEEYWSGKLNEERKIFDQEQQVSDDKFSELMSKLTEYEEEFGFNKPKNNFYNTQLATIDEKCSLEKQFNDLEDEFEDYKLKMKNDIELKNKEISLLNEKIISLQSIANKNLSVISDINDNSLENNALPKSRSDQDVDNKDQLKSDKIDNVSPVTSPIEYLWNQKTISSPISKIKSNTSNVRDYQNPNYSKESKSNKSSETITKSPESNDNVMPIERPSPKVMQTIQNNNLYNNNSEMKFEGKVLHCADLEKTLQGRPRNTSDSEKTTANKSVNKSKPSNDHQINDQENSILRITWLEVCCRQLQTAFIHQQKYYESLLQQTLAVHREEVGALRQKLEASDLLIRDLYVENCHLTGGVNHSM